ncbi:TIGR02679 family protein [Planococcus lenghuensis]|uniref:TIGR02679 family protein n=1 Tax=Planococcus lenghuensis TaxID=2213202 RepID=A0A1Q2KVP5_9BACL|nr:TIGR02679 family protein [Planococcus lenghuensis]AQQ52270.1 TIGR02679 family protein [Planococcus lenghuensis]
MNEEMIREAVRYFRSNSVYLKLFGEFRKKLESLGRTGGTVNIESYSAEELEALALFFGGLRKKKTISLIAFDKRLQETKFAGIGLPELLEAYFGEPIRSKKSVREEKREQEEAKLEELGIVHPVLASYCDYLGKRTADAQWIIRLLLTDDFTRSARLLADAANALPETYERLPMFSQRVSGNPHSFDLSGMNGKLLIHFLHFRLHGGGAPPSGTEEVNELLLQFRILRDDISNFVSFANLLGNRDGAVHPVWQAAVETESAVNMPLRELLTIDGARPAVGSDVYVIENSGVFSSLLDAVPAAPLVCTHGQFKLAGLRLLDLLMESGYHIYYAGDFDPEGVAMAVRLLERHPGRVQLWRMDAESYAAAQSPVELGDRLKKLDSITHPDVQELLLTMRKTGKAGYQEALLERMADELKEKY